MTDFVQPTIEAYKGFISRPPMEAKFLQRPPFPYILQIFIEVSNKTGFGKGLFENAELTKEHYTSPQLKLGFLKKLVLLVKMIEGNFELKIEDIVRGQQCDKTNIFLQKLASAAKSSTNTDEHVAKILDKAGGKKEEAEAPQSSPAPAQPAAASNPPPASNPQPSQGAHQREVAEMAQGAKIAQTGGQAQAEDPGKIRMGSLNRGGRKPTVPSGSQPTASKANVDYQKFEGASSASMKEAIQGITQSINPMGKIIQFIDDDMESMKKEYESWSRMYISAKEQLEDKEKDIEAELQPYRDKIVFKEEQIREKKGQIDSIKSKILRTNLKIKKLLSDIVGPN